jgi:hypothetical protein
MYKGDEAKGSCRILCFISGRNRNIFAIDGASVVKRFLPD